MSARALLFMAVGVFLCVVLTLASFGLLAVMADDHLRPEGFWYGVGTSFGIGGALGFPCLAMGVAYVAIELIDKEPS